MISLILPPKSQVSMAAKMLADEYGTASNIKSRVNRLSVLDAITSTQQRLKLFTRVRWTYFRMHRPVAATVTTATAIGGHQRRGLLLLMLASALSPMAQQCCQLTAAELLLFSAAAAGR